MNKPSIAILYICTGDYVVFWKNFYDSAEKFLLPGFDKDYFVFTDAAHVAGEELPNVHRVYQKALPWPYPTLFRFKFFTGIEAMLRSFDFIYFFNANIRICKTITPEAFLPAPDEELVVTQHPGFWNKTNDTFTYERNPASAAYIPMGEGDVYAAGGLNGGSSSSYLQFIHTCHKNVEADIEKNIIALWHDESHLNKYIIGKKVKVLHPGFLYPDGMELPFEKIIHLENKKDFIKGFGKYSFKHKLKKLFSFKKKN
ncbi:MAG: family 6 glucosyltransferase [Ferruginibacter sp.]